MNSLLVSFSFLVCYFIEFYRDFFREHTCWQSIMFCVKKKTCGKASSRFIGVQGRPLWRQRANSNSINNTSNSLINIINNNGNNK